MYDAEQLEAQQLNVGRDCLVYVSFHFNKFDSLF